MKKFQRDVLYHLALDDLKFFMERCEYINIKEKRRALESLLKNVQLDRVTNTDKELLILYYTENSFRELGNKFGIAEQNIARKIKRVERYLLGYYLLKFIK